MSKRKRAKSSVASSQPQLKKQRQNNDNVIISSCFIHKLDIKEFCGYFTSIQQTELIESFDVIRIVAEFCVGKLVTCSNDECKDGICILHENIQQRKTKKDISSPLFYCETTNKYWCENCTSKTLISCCSTQCQGHETFNCMHHQSEFLHFICNSGDGMDENQEEEYFSIECQDCGEWYCPEHAPPQCPFGHRSCCAFLDFCCNNECNAVFCDKCFEETNDNRTRGPVFCDKCDKMWCSICVMGMGDDRIGQFIYDTVWYCQKCIDLM